VKHLSILQYLWYFTLGNPVGQSFGDRSLTHSGFTDKQWIIFPPTTKGLDHALDFLLAPDQWINAPSGRCCV